MDRHIGEWVFLGGKLCRIDKECVEWVILFNMLGLTTKFCCHGDDEAQSSYEIIFHEDVTDEQIFNFLKAHPTIWGFYKWTRMGDYNDYDAIYQNWAFKPKTKKYAKELFENLCQYDDIKPIVRMEEGKAIFNS